MFLFLVTDGDVTWQRLMLLLLKKLKAFGALNFLEVESSLDISILSIPVMNSTTFSKIWKF